MLIEFELNSVQFGSYQVQNDRPSEQNSFLRVPGLETCDFDELFTKIWSKSKFEKIESLEFSRISLLSDVDLPIIPPGCNKNQPVGTILDQTKTYTRPP